ncbi:cyclodextrin-binding protein, partial [Bacillus subtilis]|nr:cyclodextrin-binding protein [Bacillus subtilis]
YCPCNVVSFSFAGINFGITILTMLDNGSIMSSFLGVKRFNGSAFSKNVVLALVFAVVLANLNICITRYDETIEVPA